MFRLELTSILEKDYIEKVLRSALPYFFILVFIITIVGIFSSYLEHNPWTMGDWLINYQGGFIRRGFLGEIIYQISYFTHINPGIYVVIFQIFFYGIFFTFSYFSLKKQHFLLPYSFLIFSPFIFTFQINNLDGGGRKEIIYFAILAFIIWYSKVKEYKNFEKVFYLIMLLYPMIILTHEMLAIFLPYLLVVYISVTNITKKNFFLITLLLLPSIFSFLFAIHYSGVSSQVAEIFSSLSRENYTITKGAISWLDKDLYFGINRVINNINHNNYLYYIPIAIFATIAYIPIYIKLKLFTKNKLLFSLILISLIGTIPLFIVAVDWGRFIYIHLVSIFLLSLLPNQTIKNHNKLNSIQPINILVVIFFIVYSLLWHIPHFDSPIKAFPQNYKQINIATNVKPFVKILSYYYPEPKSRNRK